MSQNKGFTLIELLVVIAIITLLVSILLPSIQKAKELAKSAVCQSHLKSVGSALAIYISENDGYMPPYTEVYTPGGSYTYNGVTYTDVRRYAVSSAWFKSGPYNDVPRGGDGFLTQDIGKNSEKVPGCPAVESGQTETVSWGGSSMAAIVWYPFSFGLNVYNVVDLSVTNGAPIRAAEVKNPSCIYMCDVPGMVPYMTTPSMGSWDRYTAIAPDPRHPGDRFNMVFVSGGVLSGTVDEYYDDKYFLAK